MREILDHFLTFGKFSKNVIKEGNSLTRLSTKFFGSYFKSRRRDIYIPSCEIGKKTKSPNEVSYRRISILLPPSPNCSFQMTAYRHFHVTQNRIKLLIIEHLKIFAALKYFPCKHFCVHLPDRLYSIL